MATPSGRRQKPPLPLETLVAVSGARPPPAGATREQWDIFKGISRDAAAAIRALPEGVIVVHGGADGIDNVARQVAPESGHETIVVLPWYDAFGQSAPLVRNAYVCAAPKLLAFPAPWSRGTHAAIALARAAGVDVEVLTKYGR